MSYRLDKRCPSLILVFPAIIGNESTCAFIVKQQWVNQGSRSKARKCLASIVTHMLSRNQPPIQPDKQSRSQVSCWRIVEEQKRGVAACCTWEGTDWRATGQHGTWLLRQVSFKLAWRAANVETWSWFKPAQISDFSEALSTQVFVPTCYIDVLNMIQVKAHLKSVRPEDIRHSRQSQRRRLQVVLATLPIGETCAAGILEVLAVAAPRPPNGRLTVWLFLSIVILGLSLARVWMGKPSAGQNNWKSPLYSVDLPFPCRIRSCSNITNSGNVRTYMNVHLQQWISTATCRIQRLEVAYCSNFNPSGSLGNSQLTPPRSDFMMFGVWSRFTLSQFLLEILYVLSYLVLSKRIVCKSSAPEQFKNRQVGKVTVVSKGISHLDVCAYTLFYTCWIAQIMGW